MRAFSSCALQRWSGTAGSGRSGSSVRLPIQSSLDVSAENAQRPSTADSAAAHLRPLPTKPSVPCFKTLSGCRTSWWTGLRGTFELWTWLPNSATGSATRQQAVKIWEQCLAQDPNFAEASVSIGKVRFEAGDFSRAEAVLRPVVAQSAPDNAEASFVLASSLFSQGKAAETVEVLENSRAATPATVANDVLLGQAYLRLRRHDRAKSCFLTATQHGAESANAYFGLAAACDALGQADEAAQHRRKFRELQAAQLRQSIEQTGRYDDVRSTRQDIANFYLAASRLYLGLGDAAAAKQRRSKPWNWPRTTNKAAQNWLSCTSKPAGCERPSTCCCR